MNKGNPYVRYAAKSTYFIGGKFVVAKDCHMLYLISGHGKFETENEVYDLLPNTLIYYPYGVAYKISSDCDMTFYTVNFDFCDCFADVCPMSPQMVQEFSPDSVVRSLEYAQNECFFRVLAFGGAGWAEEKLRMICSEAVGKTEYSKQAESAHLTLVLIDMMRHLSKSSNPLCLAIKSLIDEDLKRNNVALAGIMGYHPYYLNEVFRKNEGVTLHRYILQRRLYAAYKMITETGNSLDEIASECGFASLSHFSCAFKKIYGFSPSRLRYQS